MRTNSGVATRIVIGAMLLGMAACGGSGAPAGPPGAVKAPAPVGETSAPNEGTTTHTKLFTTADLNLGDIDAAVAEKGKITYDVKCQACHTLTDKRVVGPGWKGITTKREPAWIMNMIVHTDAMLETDAEAQKMLEECLVRMPNQNLSHDEARQVLEFMRTL
ncbi:MAG: cytochrome c [Flavobacteriales bacterium]|nr:cytochrome c [Flavobacteriales bacterium]